MSELVGHIKELWRYPVKSMVGEALEKADIEKFGMLGDRGWALRDETSNELTVVRKTPKLLLCRARYAEEPLGNEIPPVIIQFPDGSEVRSDETHAVEKLKDLLSKDVSLWPLQPKSNWRHYRLAGVNGAKAMKRQFASKELPDLSSFSWYKLLELSVFATPLGRYYDAYPLHILTTNSLEKMRNIEPDGDFRVERFRPNILIESVKANVDFDEFSWVGGHLSIGDMVTRCRSRTVRCSMPAQPQADIKKDARVVRAIDQHTGRHLGINADVIQVGKIRVGDEVVWHPAKATRLGNKTKPVAAKMKNKIIHSILTATDKYGGK